MFPPASGLGIYSKTSPKVIRLLLQGCTNRPFYHIVLAINRAHQSRPVIEQLGSYDPIPNQYNEQLVALNFERIQYWIGNGADISQSVKQLLGLSGFYPVHPSSFMQAWRNRQKLAKEETCQNIEESQSDNVS
ncbi:small ribosomal subunit protein bS16m [Euwallacea similis]|uniref:small ribosomal subunit protein bS16m n=1 Tax=Euwallacea similis TaxID=1736056 RepID=UPI00344FACF4